MAPAFDEREGAASVASVCVKVELVNVGWTEVKRQCCCEGLITSNEECFLEAAGETALHELVWICKPPPFLLYHIQTTERYFNILEFAFHILIFSCSLYYYYY